MMPLLGFFYLLLYFRYDFNTRRRATNQHGGTPLFAAMRTYVAPPLLHLCVSVVVVVVTLGKRACALRVAARGALAVHNSEHRFGWP